MEGWLPGRKGRGQQAGPRHLTSVNSRRGCAEAVMDAAVQDRPAAHVPAPERRTATLGAASPANRGTDTQDHAPPRVTTYRSTTRG